MAANRQCPHCGFRMFTDAPTCTNCRKPMQVERPAGGWKKTEDPVGVKPVGWNDDEEEPSAPPPIRVSVVEEREIIPHSPPQPTKPFASTSRSIDTYESVMNQPVLPASFARHTAPVLQGKVIDIREQKVEDKSYQSGDAMKNCLALVLLPLQPFIALSIWISNLGRPKNYKPVTVFTVKSDDGKQTGVRIIKDLKAGQIRMGDIVSVWGSNSHGEIILSLAYNHTLTCEVRIG